MEKLVLMTSINADKQNLDENLKKRKRDDGKEHKKNHGKKVKKEQEQMVQTRKFCTEKLQSAEDSKQRYTESKSIKKSKSQDCLLNASVKPERSPHRVKSQHSDVRLKKKKKNLESDNDITDKYKNKSIQQRENSNTDLSSVEKDDTQSCDDQEETGTWVQCSNKKCSKWRYLSDVEDPLLVADNWDCTMNSDQEHNSCDIPEVDYEENDHIYTKYTIGSVVWAKVHGYPWWPAMVECDPDYDTYYEVLEQSHSVPLQYHVTFFDEHVTRSWVKTPWLLPYFKDEIPEVVDTAGFHPYKKQIMAAMKTADSALKLSLKKRVNVFGFLKRFSSKGKKNTREKCTKLDDDFFKDISKVDSPHYINVDSSDDDFEDQAKVNSTERMKSDSNNFLKKDTPKERKSFSDNSLKNKNIVYDDNGSGYYPQNSSVAVLKGKIKEFKKKEQKSPNANICDHDNNTKIKHIQAEEYNNDVEKSGERIKQKYITGFKGEIESVLSKESHKNKMSGLQNAKIKKSKKKITNEINMKTDFIAPDQKEAVGYKISHKSDRVTSICCSDKHVTHHFKADDIIEKEGDQQVVPHIHNGTLDDCKSISDLAFSDSSHYVMESMLQDKIELNDADPNFDSIKYTKNPKDDLNHEDESGEDFVLNLDIDEDSSFEITDNEHSAYDHCEKNNYFEF